MMAAFPSTDQAPNVRSLRSDDKEQWLALWAAYNEFYGRSGGAALLAEVTETTWTRLLDPNEPMHALVVCEGNELLALAHYLFHQSTIAIGGTCYLQDLFTRPDKRGRGFARLLIEKVCHSARQALASRVYWQTHHRNEAARSLYDRLAENSGFIVYRIDLKLGHEQEDFSLDGFRGDAF